MTGDGGFDPREEVGHSGQVGQDVIPVEADKGQQLLHHLQQLERDDHQEGVESGDRPHPESGEGEHHVEVQAAEIGPQPGPARQSIAGAGRRQTVQIS